MKTERRLVSILIAMAVVFVMLGSIFYIAVEANHDCTGHDCPICEQISACKNFLKTLCTAVGVAGTYAALIFVLCSIPVCWEKIVFPRTLVTLKVKLLN